MAAMKLWKTKSFCLRPALTDSEANTILLSSSSSNSSTPTTTRIPSGFLGVYVGGERERFVIPTRFLNFRIFVALLDKASEEFGFKFSGGIALPCEVHFFRQVLELLQKDEKKYGSLGLQEFLKLISEVGFDDSSSCKKEVNNFSFRSHGFIPLGHKARA